MKYTLLLFSALLFSSCELLLQKENNVRYFLELDTRALMVQSAGKNSELPEFKALLAKADSLKKIFPKKRYSDLFFQRSATTSIGTKEFRSLVEQQIAQAIAQTREVLWKRIDLYGVKKQVVEPIKGTDLLRVEVFAEDKEQMRTLLASQGTISFLFVYPLEEVIKEILEADLYLSQTVKVTEDPEENLYLEDTPPTEKIAVTKSPISTLLKNGNNSSMWYSPKDTAALSRFLKLPEVRKFFRKDLAFVWGKPEIILNDTLSELMTIQLPGTNYQALSGSTITKASVNASEEFMEVNFTFNTQGAQQWKRMTRVASSSSPKKRIAVVLDHVCLTAPIVMSEIPNGSSSISGNYTLSEALVLSSLLQSGSCPTTLLLRQEEEIKK